MVESVARSPQGLVVHAAGAAWHARAVVSATGNWRRPYIPPYPGQELFQGLQLHSAHYVEPSRYAGQRVLIVGGGNSGAQILADVSTVARTTWVTEQPPCFLPDDVDGAVLFQRATESWRAQQEGRAVDTLPGGFGDIVMVPPMVEARSRGVLDAREPFERFTSQGERWHDGTEASFDAVIWCTGFRPALNHVATLGLLDAQGRVAVTGTRSTAEPRLWLVGYGDWTGMASATLIGIMRSARATVQEIEAFLTSPVPEPGTSGRRNRWLHASLPRQFWAWQTPLMERQVCHLCPCPCPCPCPTSIQSRTRGAHKR